MATFSSYYDIYQDTLYGLNSSNSNRIIYQYLNKYGDFGYEFAREKLEDILKTPEKLKGKILTSYKPSCDKRIIETTISVEDVIINDSYYTVKYARKDKTLFATNCEKFYRIEENLDSFKATLKKYGYDINNSYGSYCQNFFPLSYTHSYIMPCGKNGKLRLYIILSYLCKKKQHFLLPYPDLDEEGKVAIIMLDGSIKFGYMKDYEELKKYHKQVDIEILDNMFDYATFTKYFIHMLKTDISLYSEIKNFFIARSFGCTHLLLGQGDFYNKLENAIHKAIPNSYNLYQLLNNMNRIDDEIKQFIASINWYTISKMQKKLKELIDTLIQKNSKITVYEG